jgi:hypothetical protein
MLTYEKTDETFGNILKTEKLRPSHSHKHISGSPTNTTHMTDPSPIAKGETDICIDPSMANRHGLIAGSTGTGKTVTLRVLIEQFSSMGVPVFVPDIKGDLSGLCKPGGGNTKIEERAALLGLTNLSYEGYPVRFWDLYGKEGHPVRTTISEMGPPPAVTDTRT